MTLPYAYYSNSKQGFYITEFNYSSYPEDVISLTKEEHTFYIKELNTNNKIIVVTDNTITLQEKPKPVLTWEDIRTKRNRLLELTDYTQLSDFPETNKSAWSTYRQTLRDIPQTYATPEEVIWPTPPT